MQNQKVNKLLNFQNSPVAWFAVLERARYDNNYDLAARARRELERLGVVVKYHKSNKGGHDE